MCCPETLLLPDEPVQQVVYLPGDAAQAEAIFPLLTTPAALVSIPVDWNRDLSPWPSPGVFRAGGDFAGGAPAFLQHLTEEIIPRAEAQLPLPVGRRFIAGYSLAGLFALWAAHSCGRFHGAASMSGSLWYEGFLPWAQAQCCQVRSAYLSVGDREAKTRNARMAPVELCTRDMASLLTTRGVETTFTLERGGHFDDPTGRIARGISWLLSR